jgi:glycosyltransferase involved in cell wall biosynthesis
MSESRTQILIAGDTFAFPHGTGSTARVLAIARGLQSAGADVLVLHTGYSNDRPEATLNSNSSGSFEGVPFRYAAGTSTRPQTFMRRRVARVKGVAGVSAPFLPWAGPPPDAVLLFTGHSMLLPILARIASWARGAVMLFDGCEQPFVYEQDSFARRIEERLYTPLAFRAYDGIFVISEHLERYFSSRMRREARTLLTPILVDIDRFSGHSPGSPGLSRYIAYTGELSESKGVHHLIVAFAALAAEFPDVNLKISGRANPASYKSKLTALIREFTIGHRVEFVGMVPYHDFPRLLQDATVLVVPHPPGTFSEAAFPTKLGECLASGTPTVATKVGEIERYVHNGEDIYLVPPADPEAMATALRHVLRHPEEAAQVGLRGRETARECFDYRVHGKRLLAFIHDLQNSRALSHSRTRQPS